MSGDIQQGTGKLVDGVVRAGQRTVATGVGHFELITLIDLLRRLHRVGDFHTIADGTAAAFIEDKRCINQIPVFGQKVLDTVGRASFLIGRQRQDDVPVRLVAFPLQPNHQSRPDCRLCLVIRRSATVVVPIAFQKLKWCDRPIRRVRLNHIDMGQQDNGSGCSSGTAQSCHQVALALARHDDLHILRRVTRIEQALFHGARSSGVVTLRISGVDFDELFEDLLCKQLVTGQLSGNEARANSQRPQPETDR